MNRRVLWGMTFALALAVLQASAFAQAAAESVLLNAGASTATAKAGSALKSTSDRVSKQLAGRVQRQTLPPAPGKTSPVGAQPVSASAVQGTAAREGTTPAPGPVIASIQGAQTTCAPTDRTGSRSDSKTAPGSAQTNCSGQDSPRKPAPQKHPSVITLSFSK